MVIEFSEPLGSNDPICCQTQPFDSHSAAQLFYEGDLCVPNGSIPEHEGVLSSSLSE